MAAKKLCQEKQGKNEKDVFGVTVGAALLNLQGELIQAHLRQGRFLLLVWSFLSNSECHDWWTSMPPPVASHDPRACTATPSIDPPPCWLLCILSNWLRQGGARGRCDTAFPYRRLRLQEFVLIPGTVKFDFVCAAVNP